MIYTKKWCEKKPLLVAIIAPQLASSSEACYRAMRRLKIGDPIVSSENLPSSKKWLSLYKNHDIVETEVKAAFRELGNFAENGVDLFDIVSLSRIERRRLGATKFNKKIRRELKKLSREDWNDIWEFWNHLFEASLEDIKSDIYESEDQASVEAFMGKLESPEFLFFFRVWTPCWLLYQEYPTNLLRKARNGNYDALEKLLRLDSTTLNDPKVSEIYHQAGSHKNRAIFNLIATSIQKNLKSKVTRQKIKISIAGLISAISKLINSKLDEPEIRSLFDAIAMDSGNSSIDTDLPDGQEAFSKAIQRERKFWMPLFQTRTKNSS
jgi:hypothetical protein